MKMKSMLISGAMAVMLLVSNIGSSVHAADVKEIPASEVDSVYNMQVQSNTWEGWTQGPHIYSESGIVMDVDSGAILYAKNIDDQHYPASITKVMTALVALQNYELDEVVKFTWDNIGFLEYGDAHIGIKPDEEISMEDALFGMLLASANEVSHAIGAHMEGGYEAFLAEMNRVSAEIGCTNSHWMNTHGLHDPEHYTSVHDMAVIGSEVFQYEKFREITGTYQHTIPATNITNETRTFQQNHKMLRDWDHRYYEYCVGGKTGYTDQALTTLVTFASKDGVNLVSVVMRTHGGGNNAYVDSKAMLEYAFNNFTKAPITYDMVKNENTESVENDAYIMLPQGVTVEQLTSKLTEPTELDDYTAEIVYYYGDNPVGEAEVTITEERYKAIHGIDDVEMEKPDESEDKDDKKGMPLLLKILIGFVVVVFVLFATLMGFVIYRRKQIEKKRRLRRKRMREKYRNQREY